MDSRQFVEELDRFTNEALAGMTGEREPAVATDVRVLLRIAMRNEFEATELAAHWMPSTPELDVKLGLARQVGDESKHYNLLARRYRDLGGDLDAFDPREGGYSPLFEYLTGLTTSVERIAAGQFTREAIAEVRNDVFIEYLCQLGDTTTADIYEKIIQPDEEFHQNFGRRMLEKYATTPELQNAAREASRRTLEIAERLREAAARKTGVYQIPGC